MVRLISWQYSSITLFGVEFRPEVIDGCWVGVAEVEDPSLFGNLEGFQVIEEVKSSRPITESLNSPVPERLNEAEQVTRRSSKNSSS